jgi:GNAT superfamily N-acetyltransferase
MYEIKQGGSLTCGCSAHRVSSPVLEIRDFLNQECVEVELEHKVDRLAYDIFVPSSNLLIELNGLRWHSMPGSKERDYRKWRHALDGRYGIIVLFEDEWKFSKNAVKAIISNRIRLAVRKMRPNMCFISAVSSEDADSFYSKNHYIGPCHPKISYGAFHQGRLIACCSFSHPTRQSKHTWELVRMASDPEYRIHGIWSKLLKMFCNLYSPISVVSFSDNRLFTGTVYERMGFKHDGEVLPDYYWVKGNRRFHKSAMRKRGEERISGKTETELREAQGYRKIWDLGKKRWVLTSGNI